MASVIGISAGSVIHTLAAVTGLSVLLATSATAFMAVKFVGAAYLIYLGARMVFSRATPGVRPTMLADAEPAIIFRQGLLTNLLNPKVALFFLAFVPQFIAPESDSKFLAFLVLGFCFITTGTLWCLCLVAFASLLGDRLRVNTRMADWLNRSVGALFIFLGARLAVIK